MLQGWVKDKVKGSKRRATERLSESRSTLNQLTKEEMERIGETSCLTDLPNESRLKKPECGISAQNPTSYFLTICQCSLTEL